MNNSSAHNNYESSSSEDDGFECLGCDKVFRSEGARKQHMRSSHNTRYCTPCDRLFSNQNNLTPVRFQVFFSIFRVKVNPAPTFEGPCWNFSRMSGLQEFIHNYFQSNHSSWIRYLQFWSKSPEDQRYSITNGSQPRHHPSYDPDAWLQQHWDLRYETCLEWFWLPMLPLQQDVQPITRTEQLPKESGAWTEYVSLSEGQLWKGVQGVKWIGTACWERVL